jgi:hypothetical protein
MIFEYCVHGHTAETIGITDLVFKYLKLIPIVPVQPIPGAKPYESLTVLNNRLNPKAREILRVGQLSEADVPAFDYRYSNDVSPCG